MQENLSTTQAIDAFIKALKGQNFSPKTIRAYGDDLAQFLAWFRTIRVDCENPRRIGKQDIEAFLLHLSGRNLTGVSRARKLAAIRKFFAFLKENGVIPTNPAAAVKGTRREEKEPAILYKEQYKALLYEASDSPRDYAIIMTFLQTGIRLSELAGLRLEDVDFENRLLTVRQGKGRKDRQIPLVDVEVKALRNYLRYRAVILDDDTLFLAKNGTSLNVSSVMKLCEKTGRRLRHAGFSAHGVHVARSSQTSPGGTRAANSMARLYDLGNLCEGSAASERLRSNYAPGPKSGVHFSGASIYQHQHHQSRHHRHYAKRFYQVRFRQ
jgi:site-specific recombinase XerD